MHALLLPKCGEARNDCEDAMAVACEPAGRGLRAAVADGASSSGFSGPWAQLLTQSFVSEPIRTQAALLERLPALSERWNANVFSRPLPWHAIERARRGAFAALAGVEVESGEPMRWRGCAVGDSCIVHVRQGRIVSAVPLSDPRAFAADPILISTDGERNEDVETGLRFAEGLLLPEDTLVLATDALAQYVLSLAETDAADAAALLLALEQSEAAIDDGRERGALRNDDVAAVLIRAT